MVGDHLLDAVDEHLEAVRLVAHDLVLESEEAVGRVLDCQFDPAVNVAEAVVGVAIHVVRLEHPASAQAVARAAGGEVRRNAAARLGAHEPSSSRQRGVAGAALAALAVRVVLARRARQARRAYQVVAGRALALDVLLHNGTVDVFGLNADHGLDEGSDRGGGATSALGVGGLVIVGGTGLPQSALAGAKVRVLVVVAVGALRSGAEAECVQAAEEAAGLAFVGLVGTGWAGRLELSSTGEADCLDPLDAGSTLALLVGGGSASYEHELDAVVASGHREALGDVVGASVGADAADLGRVVVDKEARGAVAEGVDLVGELEVAVRNPLVDVEQRGGALARVDVRLLRAVPANGREALRELLPAVVHNAASNGVESRVSRLALRVASGGRVSEVDVVALRAVDVGVHAGNVDGGGKSGAIVAHLVTVVVLDPVVLDGADVFLTLLDDVVVVVLGADRAAVERVPHEAVDALLCLHSTVGVVRRRHADAGARLADNIDEGLAREPLEAGVVQAEVSVGVVEGDAGRAAVLLRERDVAEHVAEVLTDAVLGHLAGVGVDGRAVAREAGTVVVLVGAGVQVVVVVVQVRHGAVHLAVGARHREHIVGVSLVVEPARDVAAGPVVVAVHVLAAHVALSGAFLAAEGAGGAGCRACGARLRHVTACRRRGAHLLTAVCAEASGRAVDALGRAAVDVVAHGDLGDDHAVVAELLCSGVLAENKINHVVALVQDHGDRLVDGLVLNPCAAVEMTARAARGDDAHVTLAFALERVRKRQRAVLHELSVKRQNALDVVTVALARLDVRVMENPAISAALALARGSETTAVEEVPRVEVVEVLVSDRLRASRAGLASVDAVASRARGASHAAGAAHRAVEARVTVEAGHPHGVFQCEHLTAEVGLVPDRVVGPVEIIASLDGLALSVQPVDVVFSAVIGSKALAGALVGERTLGAGLASFGGASGEGVGVAVHATVHAGLRLVLASRAGRAGVVGVPDVGDLKELNGGLIKPTGNAVVLGVDELDQMVSSGQGVGVSLEEGNLGNESSNHHMVDNEAEAVEEGLGIHHVADNELTISNEGNGGLKDGGHVVRDVTRVSLLTSQLPAAGLVGVDVSDTVRVLLRAVGREREVKSVPVIPDLLADAASKAVVSSSAGVADGLAVLADDGVSRLAGNSALEAVLVRGLLNATRALGILLLVPKAVTGSADAVGENHIVVIQRAQGKVVPAVVRERADVNVKRVGSLEDGLAEIEAADESSGHGLHCAIVVGVSRATGGVGGVAEVLADKEDGVVVLVLLRVVGLLRGAHEAGDALEGVAAGDRHSRIRDRLPEDQANRILALCDTRVVRCAAARVARAVGAC
mmetsp:Transcript_20113/g.77010  ORF Transcript_20113/g.77010 Transcript_20113/m.77010 type:complete len:1347 (-) Transcript_20113:244-4284(-)